VALGRSAKHDRFSSINRQLEHANAMYDSVVGFEGRVKWRKIIRELQSELMQSKYESTRLRAIESA
jgi:hypothetical protein